MPDYEWQTAPPAPDEFATETPHLPNVVRQLLWNRGIRTCAAADQFLNPNYNTQIHDPLLFRDMPQAVERLIHASRHGEKIVVHGDYDADGVSASVIIMSVLKILGANTEVFLPHRERDGYGLNHRTVDALYDAGAKIIITCDCGISNTAEIAHAKERGMDVIITDHHQEPHELPQAFATLHPKINGETYPDKGLSGGGVAFKLAQALLRAGKTEGLLPANINPEHFEKWLLDLVAISSVADMVPLLGETRTLVHFGLVVLKQTRRLGLKKLMETARTGKIDAAAIGFQIAPRINAAGRMQHAQLAFDLLMSEDAAAAEELAAALQDHNSSRREITKDILEEARSMLGDAPGAPAIIVYKEDWPAGIIGLVANKLKDEWRRPAVVMTLVNGEVVGSGRSVPEWNMIEGLKKIPHLFKKFGGHPQACGFSLARKEAVMEFTETLNALVAAELRKTSGKPQLTIDGELTLSEVTWDLYDVLRRLEPFGVGNAEPRYAARGVTVADAAPIGANGKHLRLLVCNGGNRITKFIGFGWGDRAREFPAGVAIDLAFEIAENEFRGERELLLKIVDIKP